MPHPADHEETRFGELMKLYRGDTPKEVLANIREAIDIFLKNALEYGLLKDLEHSLRAHEKFTSSIKVQG